MNRKTINANKTYEHDSPFKPKWPRTVWEDPYRLSYLDLYTESIAQRFDRLYKNGNLSDHDRGLLILFNRKFRLHFGYGRMVKTLNTNEDSERCPDNVIEFLDELEARYARNSTNGT
jgi:hypothetical protein